MTRVMGVISLMLDVNRHTDDLACMAQQAGNGKKLVWSHPRSCHAHGRERKGVVTVCTDLDHPKEGVQSR